MPLDAGQNFAPVAPLTKAKRVENGQTYSSLSSIWRDKYQECVDRSNPDARREIIETARNISGLRAGKLSMKRDTINGGFIWLKKLSNQQQSLNRSNFPLFPQNSETLKAKWAKVTPQVQARYQGDGYKAVIQANLINRAMAHYFRQIFTKEYELNEAISAQDYGVYITEFYIDDFLNQLQKVAPIIQNVTKTIVPGYGACKNPQCGHETDDPKSFMRDGEAMPRCPKCDSYQVTKMVNPVVMDQATVVDAELITQGDVSGRLLEWPSVLHDPRFLPHESPFKIVSQYVSLRLVRSMFNIDLQSAEGDYELEVMEQLANRGSNIAGQGESNLFNQSAYANQRPICRRMSLDVEEYAGCMLEKDEETLAGIIPAKVPFEEIWPKGVEVTGWNDFTLQTKVDGYCRMRLRAGAYYLQSHSGHGKGLNDSVDIAKDLNELHSMAMAGLKRMGAGGVYYDKDSATPEQIRDIFKPYKAVPLDLSKNGVRDIRAIIGQLNPTPVNPVVPQYAIQLSNLLNMTTLTGDFTQGMVQDVDINTFGGQRLAAAKAEEQKGAIITMKVSHREGSAAHIHELHCEVGKLPRFFSADQSKQGFSKGKYITGSELPRDVKFDAIPGSEAALNKFEEDLAAQDFFEKCGGIGPVMQAAAMFPKETGWAAKKFGVDLPTLDEDEIQIVCLARLDNIKETAEFFGDPNATIANLKKPLWVRESNLMLKAQFLGDILDDDEVMNWSPVVRATVQQFIEMHYDLIEQAKMTDMMRQQAAAGQVQAQANQLMMAAQQPMVDQQKDQAADEQNNAIGAEILNRVADEDTKEADHDRQEEAADKAHQRNLELEDRRAANKPKDNKK